jgi:magnesium transporter
MLQCERYYPATGAIEAVEPAQLPALLAQPDVVLWIDLTRPDEEQLHWLAETFHLHPLAVEDLHNQRQRPKVDRYDDYLFVSLRVAHYHKRSHRFDTHELDMILGTNYLVTVHQNALPGLEHVRHRWEQTHPAGVAAPFLFYLVLDSVVDGYFPIVDAIGDRIDTLDVEIFANATQASLQSIFTLRRSLLSIRKVLGPTRDMLNELLRLVEESPGQAALRAYYIDVFDHVLRLTDFIDTYRDMLSGSLEAYQSTLANQLNTNMQRLTVGATVLATATVITGFYGMNLRGLLINSAWPYGGHALLITLVVVTIIELWLFRRKGWI